MKYPIPNDWAGADWCSWAICWPDSPQWLALLRGFITLPQRGRTWDESTGDIRETQLIGRDITTHNLPMEESIMSCSGAMELSYAIRYLADRMFDKPVCCDGSNGVTAPGINGGLQGVITVGEEEVSIIGTQPPGGLPGGSGMPSEGFVDQAEYDTYKCQVAHQIIDGAVATLRNLAAISVGNITAVAAIIGLAFAGIIVLPWAAIPILVSAMGALFGGLIVLGQVGDDIETHRDDYICALYNSNDTEGALGAVMALISAALTSIGLAAGLHPAIKIVITVIFSSDTLNLLWGKLVSYSYPGADCGACTGEWELLGGEELISGNLGMVTSGFVLKAVENSGFPGVFYVDLKNSTNACRLLTVTGGTNYTPAANRAPGSNTIVTRRCDTTLYGHGSASPVGVPFEVGDGQIFNLGASAAPGSTVLVSFSVSSV